jgi:hypothetical protein
VGELRAAINPERAATLYFLTVGPYENEYKARSQAAAVAGSGGAGYILMEEKSTYYVVLATYFDKKSAQAVAKKNNGTIIIEKNCDIPDFSRLASAKQKTASDTYKHMVAAIQTLYGYTEELDKGEKQNSEILASISDVRNELLNKKTAITDGNLPVQYKNYLASIIDPVFGGLDAIITMNYGTSLSAAIRYVIACGGSALVNVKIPID